MKVFIRKTAVIFMIVLLSIVAIVLLIPHPCSYFHSQSVKDEMLADPKRPQSLVLLGGSNVAYGFLSQVIQDSLGINVINDGFHAGLGMEFILENCTKKLHKGDVLVICPEYEHFLGNGCHGEPLGLGLTVLSDLGYLNTLNCKQLRIVSRTMPYYIKTMIPYYKFWDGLDLSCFNTKGDMIHDDNEKNSLPSPTKMEDTVLNEEYISSFFDQLHSLENNGINVVIYPPSFAFSFYYLNKDVVNTIGNRFEKAGMIPLCNWADCAYSDSLFYDTRYHLNKQGAMINTCHLIDLLKSNI